MGSGSGGPYSGTNGGSQPYAATYHVVDKELAHDKKDPDIYDPQKGYFKNPTSINIEKSVKDNSIYIAGNKANGTMTYVLDKNGDIIVGKRFNPNDNSKRSPHPTLIGGKDPEVQCAGMITFKSGKIFNYNNESGHYKPNSQSLPKVQAALDKLYKSNPLLFHKDSKWRKNK